MPSPRQEQVWVKPGRERPDTRVVGDRPSILFQCLEKTPQKLPMLGKRALFRSNVWKLDVWVSWICVGFALLNAVWC